MSDAVEPVADLTLIERDQLAGPAQQVAPTLLGLIVRRREQELPDTLLRIVEVEAYGPDDPASHAARGRTARNAAMFGRPGSAYVYLSYGRHWCLNVVVDRRGTGAAVLLRAGQVLVGHERVRTRRPTARRDEQLAQGPGRLGASLDIDRERHDGSELVRGDGDLTLLRSPSLEPAPQVAQGPRIGISRGVTTPWRWWITDRPEVSRRR